MERETFSTLLGGPVQRDQCVRDGHERCEFRVSPPPDDAGDPTHTPATEL
jgi:hypothetical protein